MTVSSIHRNEIAFFDGDPHLRRDCGALGKAIDFCNGLLLCSTRRCECARDELSFCCRRYGVHGEMFSRGAARSAAAAAARTSVGARGSGGWRRPACGSSADDGCILSRDCVLVLYVLVFPHPRGESASPLDRGFNHPRSD